MAAALAHKYIILTYRYQINVSIAKHALAPLLAVAIIHGGKGVGLGLDKRALNEQLQPGVELLGGLKGELRLVGGHLTSLLAINGKLLWNSKLDIASSPGQLTHPMFTCVL